jgi:hypothetical protein
MIAVVVSLYFVISLCILFFMLTGQLSQGVPMLFEMRTPSYTHLFLFQIICIAIMSVCFAIRIFLGRERSSLSSEQ